MYLAPSPPHLMASGAYPFVEVQQPFSHCNVEAQLNMIAIAFTPPVLTNFYTFLNQT